jgi:hypothetical protein
MTLATLHRPTVYKWETLSILTEKQQGSTGSTPVRWRKGTLNFEVYLEFLYESAQFSTPL